MKQAVKDTNSRIGTEVCVHVFVVLLDSLVTGCGVYPFNPLGTPPPIPGDQVALLRTLIESQKLELVKYLAGQCVCVCLCVCDVTPLLLVCVQEESSRLSPSWCRWFWDYGG